MRRLSGILAVSAITLGAATGSIIAQRSYAISPPGVEATDPAISPDGRMLAYDVGPYSMNVVRLDGSLLMTIGKSANLRKTFSADGRYLVFDSGSCVINHWGDVWLLDTADASLRCLSAQIAPHGGYVSTISEDGWTVAFVDFSGTALHLMNPDGTNHRQIAVPQGVYGEGGPSLTADGSVIVFESSPWPNGDGLEIYRVNSDGSGLAQLTMDPNRTDYRPRVSADGTVVVFAQYINDLWLVHGDGSGTDQITSGVSTGYAGEGRDFSVLSGDNCPATYNPDQNHLGDPVVQVVSPNGGVGQSLQIGTLASLTWTATDVCGGVGLVDLYLSRDGAGGPYETIALGISNSGSFDWRVTGPATSGAKALLRVKARDPAGNFSQDESDAAFRIVP